MKGMRTIMLTALLSCREEESKEDRCWDYFAEVEACIARHPDTDGPCSASSCLLGGALGCNGAERNELADVYADQLWADCRLFADTYVTMCADALGHDPTDDTRALLEDACVEYYLGEPFPDDLLACASFPHYERFQPCAKI
jgi:hypothetical protein